MCYCGLTEDTHWYIDKINAPHLYQIAETPEQAEFYLRSWAGKVLRLGHVHLDLRPLAARILSSHSLYMIAICNNNEIHPAAFWTD